MAKKKKSKSITTAISFREEQKLRRLKDKETSSLKLLKAVEKSRKKGYKTIISKVEQKAEEANKKFTKVKESIEQRQRTNKKLKSLAEKAITGELKSFKKSFLKRPKAKGPTPISATKTLSRFAQTSGPLVREVPQVEVVQDNRSQFFKDEFIKEKRRESKWFS